MPSKPETTFTQGVHRHLPAAVYHMKNNNPYMGGVPDVWYSGRRSDLWVEYKYLPRVPQRGEISPSKLLSPLQMEWLNGRSKEGRTLAVIVGCPSGGIILRSPVEWTSNLTASEYTLRLVDRKAIALWIAQTTMG